MFDNKKAKHSNLILDLAHLTTQIAKLSNLILNLAHLTGKWQNSEAKSLT